MIDYDFSQPQVRQASVRLLDQRLGRDAKLTVQLPNHRQGERPFATEVLNCAALNVSVHDHFTG